MANVVGDYALDNGLNAIKTYADKIYLCSQDPLSFTDATSTYALGNNNFGVGNVFSAPAPASPNGRQITSNPVSSGTVTGTGTATKWAVVDSVNSRLLANGSLAAGQAVSAGNTFTLASFNIRYPNQ
jgi:hypothetical protein